ncbi:MAG: alpha-N-acetylglucosaminidase C-terminal domain-containing protein [Planctomycetota bacterium]|nr:alpha-N-acetylglucosaminidase C-terminal domain-containing protein [Planctomycetota bacterium]
MVRRLLIAFVALASSCGYCLAGPEQAARSVLERLLPGKADQFVFEIIPPQDGRDVFEIESVGGKIVLRGPNGVAMASALHWYLKQSCHANVSWCGNQLALPDPLPPVPAKVRIESPYRWRYYFNYCTFSYTMAFWDWDRWQREIDWMALHGVNLPLALTGQEAIWREVYRKMGLTDDELGQFFAGPAYFAWGWMGNLDGWGGPLPPSWIDSHRDLQKKILARERELGMTPVLPAFSGHVPQALAKKFPKAKIQRLHWDAFATSMLDVNDPLFATIGKAFLDEQARQFGTDHYYSADTFNEMTPPSNAPAYLAASSKAVFESMAAADPRAVWVMQGWLFQDGGFWKEPQIKGLLSGVPDDRLLLLDLFCESNPVWKRTHGFYGKPYIWCALHVFGGNRTLQGDLKPVAKNLPAALADPARGKLTGMGMTMEGIETNPVYYDLLTEMAWHADPPNLEQWISGYARRRCGGEIPQADRAWQLLRRSAYNGGQVLIGTPVCAVPSLAGENGWVSPKSHYNPADLLEAWRLLGECAARAGNVDAYQYDLVDVARQVLANLAGPLHSQAVAAYRAKDRPKFKAAAARFLGLIRDMDDLLATRREFLLGRWTADARRWATNDREKALYEFNARNQITFWGGRDSGLHGYAHKQWSGLLKGFYLPRWEMFFQALDDSLASGKELDLGPVNKRMTDFGQEWVHKVEPYPDRPAGQSVEVALALLKKYEPIFARAYDYHPSLTTGRPAQAKAGDPALALDGMVDIGRYWEAPAPASLTIDLQGLHAIDRVHVFPYWDGERYYQYTVEVSPDGRDWRTVADRSANLAPATAAGDLHKFPPTSARYLRVTMLKNSDNPSVHLVEVRAYEAGKE